MANGTDIQKALASSANELTQPPAIDYANFISIDAAKQQRIINAAMQEFALHSYDQASTNIIVKEAGISKGLLFYYFQSKAGLYAYLINHALALITNSVFDAVDMTSGDIFAIVLHSMQVKLETTRRFPLEIALYTRALTDTSLPNEIRSGIEAGIETAFDMLALISANLDASLLKDGLDKTKAAKLINWFIEGITHEILAGLDAQVNMKNWQKYADEVEDYSNLMRKLFYKEV